MFESLTGQIFTFKYVCDEIDIFIIVLNFGVVMTNW